MRPSVLFNLAAAHLPERVSAPALYQALHRIEKIRAVGVSQLDLSDIATSQQTILGLAAPTALPEPESLLALRAMVLSRLPTVDLPESSAEAWTVLGTRDWDGGTEAATWAD